MCYRENKKCRLVINLIIDSMNLLQLITVMGSHSNSKHLGFINR